MAKYKFKGYTISCCGYHQPDHCVWWEAVDDSGCACFHGTTLREVEFMILDSEWEDKLKAKDRELAAKDDERLTIVAMYENVIAAKDAEIAKLRTLTTHTDNSEVDVFDAISKTEQMKSAALLSYAAMIERCDKAVESMHTQLMHLANEGKTTVDIGRLSKYFAHLENILRGDAGKEEK